MGMPQMPDGKNRPTFDETIIDLLESVALEEMALAHVLNAEGEKMQEIMKRFACCGISFEELESGSKSAQSMISTLIMKEWLLMNKLGMIMEVSHTIKEDKKMKEDPRTKVCDESKQHLGDTSCYCKGYGNQYNGCEKKEKINYYCRQNKET